MCRQCAPAGGWTRRGVLSSGVALGVAAVLPARIGAEEHLGVLPRRAWAGDDHPPGPLVDEPDVRFLLVHHTVNDNGYGREEVPALLRDIHRFHTGPGRGWPDIAYNFIVDRFGQAWETRAGSLERPVAGDATGGNQGFDQKCAFLGDHRIDAPSPEAVDTMTALLAFLADRSDVDTHPGAVTTFASRGSNRHPVGHVVETPTITGHRTMSQTACPGDAAFGLVENQLPAAVTARRRGPTAPTSATPSPSSTAAPTSTSTDPAPTTATSRPPVAPSTAAPSTASGSASAAGRAPDDGTSLPWPVVGAAGGLVAVVAGGLLALKGRTLQR